MMMVQLKSMDHYNSLPVNKYGIKEPSVPEGIVEVERVFADNDQSSQGLDLILVPGLAFSHANNARLGHGKGYYDEFLSTASKSSQPPDKRRFYTIGLALKQQIVESHELPVVAGHDFYLDEVMFIED